MTDRKPGQKPGRKPGQKPGRKPGCTGRTPVDAYAFGMPTPLRALARKLWSELKEQGYCPEYVRKLTKSGRRMGSRVMAFSAGGYVVRINVRSNIWRVDEKLIKRTRGGALLVVAERNSLWQMQYKMSDGFVTCDVRALVRELVRRTAEGSSHPYSWWIHSDRPRGRPRKPPKTKDGQTLFSWD